MVVTQEGNQALDSHGEPYVRHGGRKGLPAVWCMGRTNALSEIELRPSGTGEGTVAGVECDRVCGCGVCCSVKNVRSVGDVFFGMRLLFKNVGLWRRLATVVDVQFVSCLQLWVERKSE